MSLARGIDAELLGFLDLHLLVDQLVEDWPAGSGALLRGQGVELGALLDVEIGDGLAIDHHGDGLGVRRAHAPGTRARASREPSRSERRRGVAG